MLYFQCVFFYMCGTKLGWTVWHAFTNLENVIYSLEIFPLKALMVFLGKEYI